MTVTDLSRGRGLDFAWKCMSHKFPFLDNLSQLRNLRFLITRLFSIPPCSPQPSVLLYVLECKYTSKKEREKTYKT